MRIVGMLSSATRIGWTWGEDRRISDFLAKHWTFFLGFLTCKKNLTMSIFAKQNDLLHNSHVFYIGMYFCMFRKKNCLQSISNDKFWQQFLKHCIFILNSKSTTSTWKYRNFQSVFVQQHHQEKTLNFSGIPFHFFLLGFMATLAQTGQPECWLNCGSSLGGKMSVYEKNVSYFLDKSCHSGSAGFVL